MTIAVSREPGARREVSPLELFFDLVYVFAVGQLSHHLAAHVDVRTGAEFNRAVTKGYEDPRPSTLNKSLSVVGEILTPKRVIVFTKDDLIDGKKTKWFAFEEDMKDSSGKLLPFKKIQELLNIFHTKTHASVFEVQPGTKVELNIATQDQGETGKVLQLFINDLSDAKPIETHIPLVLE